MSVLQQSCPITLSVYTTKRHERGASGQPPQVMPSAENDPRETSGQPTAVMSPVTSDLRGREYTISIYARNFTKLWRALLDRGANGCIIGSCMRVFAFLEGTIHLNGIDDHTIQNLRLVNAGAYCLTDQGPRIIIANLGALNGKTILSSAQIEHFGWILHDRSAIISGKTPHLVSPDGVRIPMCVRSALTYLQLRPYTDEEWDTLPHLVLTHPAPWDPTCLHR